MKTPNLVLVALVACVGACGGELAAEENLVSTESPIVLGGTVFWGPGSGAVVDRAFVRILDSTRSQKCVATRCDGSFVVRRSSFPSLRFPVLVSVERAREPESREPESLVIRRLPGPISETTPALSVYLFGDESQAEATKLAPTGSCAPGVEPELVECPEDRRQAPSADR